MNIAVEKLPAHIRFAFEPDLISTTREGFRMRQDALNAREGFSNPLPVNSRHARAFGIGATIAEIGAGLGCHHTPGFRAQVREALA